MKKLCKFVSGLCTVAGIAFLSSLYLLDAGEHPKNIHVSKRIGIDYAEEAADFPWRFYL